MASNGDISLTNGARHRISEELLILQCTKMCSHLQTSIKTTGDRYEDRLRRDSDIKSTLIESELCPAIDYLMVQLRVMSVHERKLRMVSATFGASDEQRQVVFASATDGPETAISLSLSPWPNLKSSEPGISGECFVVSAERF